MYPGVLFEFMEVFGETLSTVAVRKEFSNEGNLGMGCMSFYDKFEMLELLLKLLDVFKMCFVFDSSSQLKLP